MEVKDYESLKQQMIELMKANSSKITDFNDGSVITTIFEAVANVLEEAYVDTRVGYANNLKKIATSIFDFSLKDGQKAVTSVYFSRAKAGPNVTNISSNTVISDGTHNFITTEMATIKANEVNSNSVSAEAIEVGSDFNIAKNSINSIISTVSGDVVAVTNTQRAVGGANKETENEMLARFKTYINGLQGSNYYGLKSGILNFSEDGYTVRSVGIIEKFPPEVVEDNIYNVMVYIDDGTGGMTTELKNKLTDLINGDGTSSKPGLRAVGVNIGLQPASTVYINIEGTCKIYRTEKEMAQAEIEDTLTQFINSLEISEDVIITDIILKLRQISYLKDVSDLKIGIQGGEMSLSNISLGESQIARMGTIDIEVVNI